MCASHLFIVILRESWAIRDFPAFFLANEYELSVTTFMGASKYLLTVSEKNFWKEISGIEIFLMQLRDFLSLSLRANT